MIMKKYFVWAILFALPVLAACDKDKDKDGEEKGGGGASTEVTVNNLAGTWFLNSEEESEIIEETLIFSNNGAFSSEATYFYYEGGSKTIGSQYKTEGTYKLLDGNLIVAETKKAQYRYSNNGQMSEWMDDEYNLSTDTMNVSLLYKGAVVLFTPVVEDYESQATSFFFRKGANLPNDKSELQGTWYWYEYGEQDMVRVAVKFSDDEIDMIITPWGQRYTGKYTYKDGIVKIGETTFYTSRDKSGYHDVINYTDPYKTEWRTPEADDYYQNRYPDGFSFPFVVDGKTAYSEFVGLSPIYKKQ